PTDEANTCGRIHRGCGEAAKDTRRRSGNRDESARRQMRARRDALPSVKVNSDKDGFREESESFEGKRHSDNSAGITHEGRPEETEFEGEDGSGNRADGKK